MKKQKRKKEQIKKNFLSKNEILPFAISFIPFVATLVASLYFKNKLILYFLSILLLLLPFLLIKMNRDKLAKIKEKELYAEFIEIFSYLRIYLTNNINVYSSLNLIKDLASNKLKTKLEKLILDIDEDKSIQPYLNFAKEFNNTNIEELMRVLYQIVDEGINKTYLDRFSNLFVEIQGQMYKETSIKRNNEIGTLINFAVIGSGYEILMMAYIVVSIIGDFTNG